MINKRIKRLFAHQFEITSRIINTIIAIISIKTMRETLETAYNTNNAVIPEKITTIPKLFPYRLP